MKSNAIILSLLGILLCVSEMGFGGGGGVIVSPTACSFNAGLREENPADQYAMVGDNPPHQRPYRSVQNPSPRGWRIRPQAFDSPLNGDKKGMQQAPQRKPPVRTVPEAAEQKRHRQIQHAPGFRTLSTPKGDVNIISYPGGQRHVPSSPEIGDRGRQIGPAEILRKVESHHFCGTPGNIGVG